MHRGNEAAVAWAEQALGRRVTAVERLLGGWTSTLLALTEEGGSRSVLRLVDREPWRTHGRELTTRESVVQRMLETGRLPAPRTLALDATGEHCGHPAHLMTLLPGRVAPDVASPAALDRLAALLTDVHAVCPTVPVREYQSWAWPAKHVVPTWARRPDVWERAFALLRTDPPAYEPCFLHRDFQPRNVLWQDGRVSGLVDWVETSVGPAWLDVAHCSTNLALAHGDAAADAFATAYARRTGRRPQPFFEVMDVVGFLPPPGRPGLVTDPAEQHRLEDRLAVVLARC